MPGKKIRFKPNRKRIPSLIVLVLVIMGVGFYGMRLLASHAATGSYTCNAGDTLNGTYCNHTSTYTATYYGSTYGCPSGGSLTGSSTCSYQYSANSGAYYTCNSGDALNGTTCTHTSTYAASGQWACPPGYPYLNANGGCYRTNPPQPGDYVNHYTAYSCNSGDLITNTTCSHTDTYSATAHATYSCNSGDSLSGSSTCMHSYPATLNGGYYSCNLSDSLSGSTCTHISSYTATFTASAPTVTTPTKTPTTSTSPGVSTSVSVSPTTSPRVSVSTGTSTAKSAPKSTNSNPVQNVEVPPSTPSNLKVDVVSSRLVKLTWNVGQAVAGIKEYDIERSLDESVWVALDSTQSTIYTDTATDFESTYYYRLRAVDNNGAFSDYAVGTATTGKFTNSSDSVVSDDKTATVKIPSGAFDHDVSCSVTKDAQGIADLTSKRLLQGPYTILCIEANGSILNDFRKPLDVTLDLTSVAKGYEDFTVGLLDSGGKPTTTASKYNPKTHKINFQLASNKSFAAYGNKHKSAWSTIFQVFTVLLVIGGLVLLAIFLRNRRGGGPDEPYMEAPAMPLPAPAEANATQEFEQAVARPNCQHLAMAHKVQPLSAGCQECEAAHTHWKGLRICLVCGHVGCSEDSPGQHSRKHYESTGHPLIYEYGNPKGDTIGWCYIDQTYI